MISDVDRIEKLSDVFAEWNEFVMSVVLLF